MELRSFDAAAGHHIDRFESDFVLSPLMGATDSARAVLMHLEPGGTVGTHEATTHQLFCVVAGTGWVSGADGERRGIRPFEAAWWVPGELHAAGTDSGMVAVVVEGGFTVAGRPLPE